MRGRMIPDTRYGYRPPEPITNNKENKMNNRDTVTSLRAELAAAKAEHLADIKIIAEHMKEVAADHEMCSIFYDEVEALNKKINVKLDVDKTYEGSVTMTFELSVAGWKLSKEKRYGKEMTDSVLEAALDDELTRAIQQVLESHGMTVDYISNESYELHDL